MNKLFTVIIFLLFICSSVYADECPTVPPVPAVTTDDVWVSVERPTTVTDTRESIDDVPLGIGYLRILDRDKHLYDWPANIVLPLWRSPESSAFDGWLQNGKVISGNNDLNYSLTGAGMVETEYEQNSFIVYEDTGNGWLRIRLKPGVDGERWVHQCHLKLGEAGLKYEMWQSFLWEHSTWLHFRAAVPHVLRAAPDKNSQRVTMIGLDHKLELIEFNGDWMHVRVEQPDTTCAGDEQSNDKSIRHAGWVRWRDVSKGPWTWVYTRGC